MIIALGILVFISFIEACVIMWLYSDYSYEKERADRNYDDWKDETARCKKFKKTVEEAVKSYYV